MEEANRRPSIDWQIANLDGELFPPWTHLSAGPLIQVSDTPARGQPNSEPPPAYTITTPPPPSNGPRWFTAAGVAGGALLVSLVALAFQASLPRPAYAPASAEATVDGAEPPEADGAPFPIPEVAISATAVPEIAAPPAKAIVAAPREPVPPRALTATAMELPPAFVPPDERSALDALPTGIDPASAAITLATAGRSAAGCTEPDDARASMPVSVTFAPSGRVTVARIDGGPFLGTEEGSCIARAMRAATVHPFEGSPVTIHGTIRLR